MEETGVKIGFNSAENRVSIKKHLPKWWIGMPLELRAKMIDFGWDFTKIAYYRPMRIPKVCQQSIIDVGDRSTLSGYIDVGDEMCW